LLCRSWFSTSASKISGIRGRRAEDHSRRLAS
jgi:hypothetical protein